MPSSPPRSRYLVGIDLGTTHTVVAYADASQAAKAKIEIFHIDQLVGPGETALRPLLPSVRYHPADSELTAADTQLPWDAETASSSPIIGELARTLGAKSHGRLVSSAKSWLSHGAVDRTAAILPWGAAEDVAKISPVEASASYLAHVRASWNCHFPDAPLESQEVVITIPASFDEAARLLTLDAARQAGLPHIHLVEEPQAACYDWLWNNRKTLAKRLADIRLLLVVDVGGGTTDLTLIQVDHHGEEPQLQRVAVGQHLMLGGDNIDLTLAHIAETRLASGDRPLSAGELYQLVEQCRSVKENLLADNAPDSLPVTLLGAGSRLIGGTRSTALSRDEVRKVVLDGFFPLSELSELPDRKRSGVVEFGLPYAADPAISRHIAAFLTQHRTTALQALGDSETSGVPDGLLLNGGVFLSPLVSNRLIDVLAQWRGKSPLQLKNDRPEQAVAHGAVAYSLSRRGVALKKIGGGSPRSYFLLVDTDDTSTQQAICLLPRGTEENREIVLSNRTFALRLRQPVRFHLLTSLADAVYQPGDLAIVTDEQFAELPPLAIALKPGDNDTKQEIIVQLAATLTEVGTLRLQCMSAENPQQRWDVEFQLRRRTGPQSALASSGAIHPRCGEACELIGLVFGKKSKGTDPKMVKNLRVELEKMLGKRETWDTGLLRSLFDALLEGLPHRRRSDAHERLWLNLCGFCLRPGFGYPLDDWRVDQLWNTFELGIQFVHESQNWAEWWTLWRRVAGGLNEDGQSKLFAQLVDFINPTTAKRGNNATLAGKRSYEDMLRLAAVLERLPESQKIELGEWLIKRIGKTGEPAETTWALGRVGARVPFHAGMNRVVPRGVAESWLSALMETDWKKQSFAPFAATLIARMSSDREQNVHAELRQSVIEKLRQNKSSPAWIELVSAVSEIDEADERRMFGESLPPGLKLLK